MDVSERERGSNLLFSPFLFSFFHIKLELLAAGKEEEEEKISYQSLKIQVALRSFDLSLSLSLSLLLSLSLSRSIHLSISFDGWQAPFIFSESSFPRLSLSPSLGWFKQAQ